MAESNTPRLNLRRWSANTDTFDRTELDGIMGDLEAKAAIFLEGTRAARPAPGVTGRFYTVKGDGTAALNGLQFYDNGVAWSVVGANVEDLIARASAAATIPLVAKGAAGQTAKLQEWRSSADAVLASMDAVGKLTLSGGLAVGAVAATFGGAVTITGLLTANGGITTTTLQTSGDVTAARIRSTAMRADGEYKTEINADGTVDHLDGLIPPGTMLQTAAAAASPGWLLCQGQAVSRATYVDLFNAIGTAFGAGDGSTTFNLPDMRDRVPVGASGTKALGTTGGAETVVLGEANLPPHAHSINHDHAAVWTSLGGTHDHGTKTNNVDGSSTVYLRDGNNDGSPADFTHIQNDGAHQHLVDIPNFVGNSGPGPGTSTPVSVMQPWRALNWMIRT